MVQTKAASPSFSAMRSLQSIVGPAGAEVIQQHTRVEVRFTIEAGMLTGCSILPMDPALQETPDDDDEDELELVDPVEAMANMRLAIRRLLEMHKLTQRQLARHLKMDEAQLSRILSKPQKSTYETVERILKAIDELVAARSVPAGK